MTAVEPAVVVGIDAGVARVELNRPGQGNALDLEMARGLVAAFSAVAADPQVKAVLLTARGRNFCVGGDLHGMNAASDRGAFLHELASVAHQAVKVMAGMEKPLIAAVNGAAAGAGFSLALLSDIVVAHPRASFLTAYTTIGLTPDCGQSWLLPRAIGFSRALDLTLRPRRVDGEGARELGFVAEVDEETERVAEQIARELASGAAAAHGAARLLLRPDQAAFAEHLDREVATIAAMAATAEAGDRIAAFLAPR